MGIEVTYYNKVVPLNTDWEFNNSVIEKATGNPIDLTGYTFGFQVRSKFDNSILLTMELGTGVTCSAPATGVFNCRITAAKINTLPLSEYNYGVVGISPSGFISLFAEGTLTITKARVVI